MFAIHRRRGIAEALVLATIYFAGPASGAGARPYCAAGEGPRVSVPVPRELEAEVAKAFGVPVDLVRDGGFIRCAGPKLLACVIGANLNCETANTRRSLPGANEFCRANPNSDVVPMAATGHDTIYDWRCVGKRAVAKKVVVTVDRQGYDAGNWKVVDR
jgi:hypothetical protein